MSAADVVVQVSPQGLVSPCKLAYVPPVFHTERLRPGVERKASAAGRWWKSHRLPVFPLSNFSCQVPLPIGMDHWFEEALRRMIQRRSMSEDLRPIALSLRFFKRGFASAKVFNFC